MSSRTLLTKIKDELGIVALAKAPKDTYILLLTRIFRMFAYGSSTLFLALYFSALGHTDTQIGLFMTLTLVGDVLISLGLTFIADSLGRRRILLLGSLLMAVSGGVFATTSSYPVLLLAAIVGVISPSGNEIGPFRAVEESTIAHLTPDTDRGDIFAWYVVFGTLGTSGGALSAGWMVQRLQKHSGWDEVAAYRSVFTLYAVIGLIKAGLTLLLSPECEAANDGPAKQSTSASAANHNEEEADEEEAEAFLRQQDPSAPPPPPPKPAAAAANKSKWKIAQISPSSRKTLVKLCALFSVDSLASGMVPVSLISYFISTKFPSTPTSTLGTVISIASFVSSIGNIFASSLSKRIGFVHTMVFTHLPSAVFLAILPAPHSLALTVVFLVARASLASMDQAPRSAFLSAVVLPNERTAVMGIVNTLKTTAQSGGPLVTGYLAGKDRFWIAFLVAGALKASYDLGMLVIFSGTKGRKGNADEARERVRRAEEEEEVVGQEFELASDDGFGYDEEEDEESGSEGGKRAGKL